LEITRRLFFKWAASAAVTLGLSTSDLFQLQEVLAAGSEHPIIWIQGATCTGCTISLLNTTNPSIDEILIKNVDLQYHPNLNGMAGNSVIKTITDIASKNVGEFILCVEGGIPTGMNGNYCSIGEKDGKPWTMLDALKEIGPKAKYVVAVGTCAAYGGVVKPSKYTGIKSVKAVLGNTTRNPVVNLPSCPAHPYTLIGTLVTLLTKGMPKLDMEGRPVMYYNSTVHFQCPRLFTHPASQIGQFGCYRLLGCKGPSTTFTCPRLKWNNGVNWCVDKGNTVCIGCASPNFPAGPFYFKNSFTHFGSMGPNSMM
jgi:hydrogenase small subunit